MAPAAVGGTNPHCCHVAAIHALNIILEKNPNNIFNLNQNFQLISPS